VIKTFKTISLIFLLFFLMMGTAFACEDYTICKIDDSVFVFSIFFISITISSVIISRIFHLLYSRIFLAVLTSSLTMYLMKLILNYFNLYEKLAFIIFSISFLPICISIFKFILRTTWKKSIKYFISCLFAIIILNSLLNTLWILLKF